MLLRYPLRKIITNRRIFVTALTATIIVFSVTVTLLNDFNNNSVAKKVNGLAKKFGVVIDSNFRTGYWEQAKKTAAYSEYRTLYVSLTGEEAPYDASFLEAEQAGAYLQQIIITRGISPSIEQQRALQNFAELLRDYRQVCNLNGEADLESTFFLLPESHKKTAETIFNEKVNEENIDYYISEWTDFMKKDERKDCNETVISIGRKLQEFYKGKDL